VKPSSNPHRLLRISPDATREEIDAAYDRLYSRYEEAAANGDEAAIAMLERLNDAYDSLNDSPPQVDQVPSSSGATTRQPSAMVGGAPRSGTRAADAGAETPLKLRRRSPDRPRAVQRLPQPSRTPYIVVGLLALAALITVIFFVMNRGGGLGGQYASTLDSPYLTGDEPRRGGVVATVNGRPIYQQDYDERVEMDRQVALSDPLMGVFLQNFEGITGTRALDILKQDSLDRLINLEILQQQAVKEGLFPNTSQQAGIIEDAKSKDLTGGQTFEQFLQSRNITAQQYNRRVMRNLAYALMANEYMPKEGTTDARTEAYLKYICSVRNSVDPATQRPNYVVQINLTFAVENPPCTSGLPPEIPLPDLQPEAPDPISTPAGPAGTPTTGPLGPPAP
jgi:hypothetical protein